VKEQENPFRKIKNLTSQFRTILRLSDNELEKIFISHLIVFPNYKSFFDRKICFSEYNYINAFTEKKEVPGQIIAFTRKQKEITKRLNQSVTSEELKTVMDKVINGLRHEFSVDEKEIARELSKESSEKSRKYLVTTYSMIKDLERLFISGGAGTGKTFLAIQHMIHSRKENFRILYLCYNKLLAAKIRYEFSHSPGVDVYAIEEYMLEKGRFNRNAVPLDREVLDEFYLNKLPACFMEKAGPPVYDLVIADEFQDLALPAYVRVIDRSLKNGISAGKVWFFYDPDQNLFKRDPAYPGFFLKGYGLEGQRLKLLINYRNAPNIVSLSSQILGENIYERSALHNSGIIEEHFYGDESDQKEKIEGILTSLESKYRKEDVILLSVRALERSAAFKMERENRGWGRKFSRHGKNARGMISYSNAHRFKGLESKIVIVTDIDGADLYPDLKTVLYAAVTRASFKLILLIDEKFRAEFERLVSG